MRRITLILLILSCKFCTAQEGWQIELMPALATYKGDLSGGAFSFKTTSPAIALNVKYDFGDMVVLRAGVAWTRLGANDKNNKADISYRNLSFKTDILEATMIGEVNFLDPVTYWAYPYLFTGVGLLHFNPWAYDNSGVKTYLRPLSTEGQGFPEYPDRKMYSLNQFFIPIGGGWKINYEGKYALSFELGVRYLFTDYLDDVSSTYINSALLLNRKGPKAVEMAFRATPPPPAGDMRGNSAVKDLYFMTGVKLAVYLNRPKKTK